MHRLLTTGEQRAATAQVAIHGLGGMGKTSLVQPKKILEDNW